MTLTLALPYLVFILGEDHLHRLGRRLRSPPASPSDRPACPASRLNWAFLNERQGTARLLGRSFIFILAAILVPTLLVDVGPRDLELMATALGAALVARVVVLFVLPPLSWLN